MLNVKLLYISDITFQRRQYNLNQIISQESVSFTLSLCSQQTQSIKTKITLKKYQQLLTSSKEHINCSKKGKRNKNKRTIYHCMIRGLL